MRRMRKGRATPSDSRTRAPRPDVFISYAREDVEFVRCLDASLRDAGKVPWVDWKDIPPTADWRAKVRAGIEQASAFVFVLSDRSLASEICEEERLHAEAANKRFIVVLRSDTDEDAVPASLAAPNWIDGRGALEAEAAKAVVAALDTDLPWLEQHARLLVRAVEWQNDRRNTSHLLRGTDLAAAERWLDGEGTHAERATALQREYIVAGRAAATRRRRTVLGTLTVAVLALAGLSVALLSQTHHATRATRLATSRALAARALDAVDSDPRAALRLAARARAAADSPQAVHALRAALDAPRPVAVLRMPRGIQFADWVPGTHRVRTEAYDDRLREWDIDRGTQRSIPRPSTPLPFSRPSQVGARSGLRVRALDQGTGQAEIQDAATGRRLLLLRDLGSGEEGTEPSVYLSSDERFLLTSGFDDTVKVWRIPFLRLRNDDVTAAAFSTDGGLIATTDRRGIATVRRSDGRKLVSWAFESAAAAAHDAPRVHFSLDDSAVFIESDLRASVWDPRTGAKLLGVDGLVSFSRSGLLELESGGTTARIRRTATGRTVAVLSGLRVGAGAGVFSADDRHLVTRFAQQENVIRIWQVKSGPPERTLGPFRRPVDAVDIDASGRMVLTAGGDGLSIWPTGGDRPRIRLVGPDELITNAAFSPTGAFVTSASIQGTAKVWDSTSGDLVATRTVGGKPLRSATLGPHRRLLVVALDGPALVSTCASCLPRDQLLGAAQRAARDLMTFRPATP
jgi:WD40 repeat protein